MNILSKLAMNSGMNPLIQVAYRQIFASIVIVPFAYFLERYTHCLWSHGMCIMRVRMHVIWVTEFVNGQFFVSLRISYIIGKLYETLAIGQDMLVSNA